MLQYYHQYKYIVGIPILIIIFVISVGIIKSTNDKPPEPEEKIIPENVKEIPMLLTTLINEVKKNTSTLLTIHKDPSHKKNLKKRNELFTKDIEKHLILVDSKNIDHSDNHSTSNYTVYFDGSNKSNSTGGFGTFKNVIGFRLIKAIIPNSSYQVHDKNNIVIIVFNSSQHTITLTNGGYSTYTLAEHLQNKLQSATSDSNITVTYGPVSQKYTINSGSSKEFLFKWADSDVSGYRLFGFLKRNQATTAISKTSNHAVDLSSHYVDLVIKDIPNIACKKNGRGDNVIERIPLRSAPGSLVTHYSHNSEVLSQNYFYPIKLSQLTIELFNDTEGQYYDSQNADNSFEFEITIVKNASLFT